MLPPSTLPMAISGASLSTAWVLIAICGALLPNATMVMPMISGRTCNRAATRTAERSMSSAPTISISSPRAS